MKLSLAGTGLFGEEHLRVIARMKDVEIASVVDLNGKAAQNAAERHGAKDWGTDIIELLERRKPDGLIIATPGQTHVPLARRALALGIPVLVEKPMAMTASEAASLVDIDAEGSAFVLPGHVLRFSSPHRMIADIVKAGGIGRVLSFSARRYRDDSHARRYTDIDPIMMTMIHDIDLALWMTGASVGEVFTQRGPAHEPQRSHTMMTARGIGGASWSLSTAWTFPGDVPPPDRLEIVGEQGGIDFEAGAFLRQYGAMSRNLDPAALAQDDSLFTEVSYFVHCIRTGVRPDIVTPRDAHTGLLIAEAAIASLRRNEIVRLPSY